MKLILSELRNREKFVVLHRWGLFDGVPKTYKEIGVLMDMSAEWVRNTLTYIMQKLRKSDKIQQLKGLLNEC